MKIIRLLFGWGDNGYFLGERQMAGKWLMYDNSVRVPLIIFDPRINQHYDVDDMVANVDLASTILDFAGIDAKLETHGKLFDTLCKDRSFSLQERGTLDRAFMGI